MGSFYHILKERQKADRVASVGIQGEFARDRFGAGSVQNENLKFALAQEFC
jgi:hypothetical protein